jgi:hypothetical protein
MKSEKEFVQEIYPDAIFSIYDANEIYTGALGWYQGQGFIARVSTKSETYVAIAYDMLVKSVCNEDIGWLEAKKVIEKRLLQKLEE